MVIMVVMVVMVVIVVIVIIIRCGNLKRWRLSFSFRIRIDISPVWVSGALDRVGNEDVIMRGQASRQTQFSCELVKSINKGSWEKFSKLCCPGKVKLSAVAEFDKDAKRQVAENLSPLSWSVITKSETTKYIERFKNFRCRIFMSLNSERLPCLVIKMIERSLPGCEIGKHFAFTLLLASSSIWEIAG